jgi:hypothetical protein
MLDVFCIVIVIISGIYLNKKIEVNNFESDSTFMSRLKDFFRYVKKVRYLPELYNLKILKIIISLTKLD